MHWRASQLDGATHGYASRCLGLPLRYGPGSRVNGTTVRVQLRRLEQTHTLVYVPTHKSYFDFMILPYVLFAAGLKVPHTVSGQNLRIPGVQFVMCRNGAFYIRRTMKGFTDAAIYKAVLQQYIREILLRRLSFCVYAEGGRSRDGRVQGLKMGLLSYLLDASLDAPLPQGLAFVPCAIR